MHILIFDTDEVFRESLSRMLQESGHSVAIAQDVAEAIGQCIPDCCDLVLIDPTPQAAILVRIREFNPDIPVVVMSLNPSIESVISALRLGIFDYLIKPFHDTKQLMEMIERARCSIEIETNKRAYLKRILKTFSELSIANESVRAKGYINGTTELYFNQFFDDILAIELARSQRCEHEFTVISVRLNYLPDSISPETDPEFCGQVEAISDFLHKRMRRTDVLVRTAVNEFMIILVETSKEGGVILLKSLCNGIAAIVPAEISRSCREVGTLPIAFGMAAYPLDGLDCQSLMRKSCQFNEEGIWHAS